MAEPAGYAETSFNDAISEQSEENESLIRHATTQQQPIPASQPMNTTPTPSSGLQTRSAEMDQSGLTPKTLSALYNDKAFFPSGILSAFGINEGVQDTAIDMTDDTAADTPEEMREAGPDMKKMEFDTSSLKPKLKKETKARYVWLFLFYCLLPLGDIISDFIITGHV